MIAPATHCVGAALVALLADRLVLERSLGATPFSKPSTRLQSGCGSALPVSVLFIFSAGISCALVTRLLAPIGAGYLFPLVFAAFLALAGIAGELLLSKWETPGMRNRIFGRGALGAAILGFLIVMPQNACILSGATTCGRSMPKDIVLAGAIYFLVALIWNGVHEKIELTGISGHRLSPAQELCAAGLIALAMLGISGLNFLNFIKVP